MPELLVKFPDRSTETVPLERLRITIGRSARNDLCIADPFASRVHAEVRCEGDQYILRDLNSANGTYYNGEPVTQPIVLTPRGRIQIGETEIEFVDAPRAHNASGATMIADASAPLSVTAIAVSSGNRTTSGLLEAIEGVHTGSRGRADRGGPAASEKRAAEQNDLLALISKVGVTLLSSATLDETLKQIVALVFEAVPADRCLITLRDEETDELRVRVARLRNRDGDVGEFRLSRAVIDEVIGHGKSVLTSDAQQDPRFTSGTMSIQGIRSVLAVPLGVGEKVFGLISADSPIADRMFTEDHLKVLTTLASVAAIRVENAHLTEKQIERERMERELQLAREIQQRFQP
ncbi:MAG TPA: FHA domain-containing protein, partial [Pyrinomonadaceae bacterium]|nr:FHA domain-containing protein [Pyrinomonadaceae bacterium]